MKYLAALLCVALTVIIFGCALPMQTDKQDNPEETIESAQRSPTTAIAPGDIPPQEYAQQEEEDMIFSRENAVELMTATCGETQCPNENGVPGRVCGSDDRTYENPCEACKNPQVESWIEGAC